MQGLIPAFHVAGQYIAFLICDQYVPADGKAAGLDQLVAHFLIKNAPDADRSRISVFHAECLLYPYNIRQIRK